MNGPTKKKPAISKQKKNNVIKTTNKDKEPTNKDKEPTNKKKITTNYSNFSDWMSEGEDSDNDIEIEIETKSDGPDDGKPVRMSKEAICNNFAKKPAKKPNDKGDKQQVLGGGKKTYKHKKKRKTKKKTKRKKKKRKTKKRKN